MSLHEKTHRAFSRPNTRVRWDADLQQVVEAVRYDLVEHDYIKPSEDKFLDDSLKREQFIFEVRACLGVSEGRFSDSEIVQCGRSARKKTRKGDFIAW